MAFDIGDKVIIKNNTLKYIDVSDENLFGIISYVLPSNNVFKYEVDLGAVYEFTHKGRGHDSSKYRYYRECDLVAYYEDDCDEINIDEITILLNN